MRSALFYIAGATTVGAFFTLWCAVAVSLYGFNRSESKRTFKTEEDKQLYEERMHYSGYPEYGTSKMAARPYVEKIKETAMPEILALFSELGG